MAVISVTGQYGNSYNVKIAGNAPTPQEQERINAYIAQQDASAASMLKAYSGQSAAPQEPDDGTALGRGFSRSVDITQQALGSAAEGIGGLTGLDWLRDYGASVAGENTKQLEEAEKTATRLEDVEGLGSGLSFFGETLGESSVPMGIGIGSGAAAGAAAGSILPGLGTAAGAAIGAAGAALSQLPLFYGWNRERQKQEDVTAGRPVEVSEGAAILAAIPQAVMEGVVDRMLVGKLIPTGLVREGKVLTRLVKGSVAGTVAEVPTEVGQQVLERYQAGLPLWDDSAKEEYRQAAIAAGMVGGALGGGANVVGGDVGVKRREEEAAAKAAELEADLAAMRGKAALGEEYAKADADLEAAANVPPAPEKVVEATRLLPAPKAGEPSVVMPKPAAPPVGTGMYAPVTGDKFTQQQFDAAIRQVKADRHVNINRIQKAMIKATGEHVPMSAANKIINEMAARGIVTKSLAESGPRLVISKAAARLETPDVSLRREADTLSAEIADLSKQRELLEANRRVAEQTGVDLSGKKADARKIGSAIDKLTSEIEAKSKRASVAEAESLTKTQPIPVPKAERVGAPVGKMPVPLSQATPQAVAKQRDIAVQSLANVTNQIKELETQRRKLTGSGKVQLNSFDQEKANAIADAVAAAKATRADIVGKLKGTPEAAIAEARAQEAADAAREADRAMQAEVAKLGQIGLEMPLRPAAAPIFGEKTQSILEPLRRRLNNLGLKNVGLSLERTIAGGKAEGSYDPTVRMIALAVGIYDPKLTKQELFDRVARVMDHEVIHALKAEGLFTDAEWAALSRAAKDRKYVAVIGGKNVKRNYTYLDRANNLYKDDSVPYADWAMTTVALDVLAPDVQKALTKAAKKAKVKITDVTTLRHIENLIGQSTAEAVAKTEYATEEAVAEMFRDYVDGRVDFVGHPKRMFERIKDFFLKLFGTPQDGALSDAERIMKSIRTGQFGARQAAQSPASTAVRRSKTANTNTEAFKSWFGKSKAVDEFGNPLVLYHGTQADFESFKPLSWLTPEIEMANDYSQLGEYFGRPGGERKTIATYARIENPFDTDLGLAGSVSFDELSAEAMDQAGESLTTEKADAVNALREELGPKSKKSIPKHWLWNGDMRDYTVRLMNILGFDGMVYREISAKPTIGPVEMVKTYAAMEPSQIKSVENAGTWSPDDDRIRYSKAAAQRADSDPDFKKWEATGEGYVLRDESGTPRVFYSGTSKDKDFTSFNVGRHGAWFTADPEEASMYAESNDSMDYKIDGWKVERVNTASRVIPAFVRVSNPFTGKMPDDVISSNYKASQSKWFDSLKRQGYDAWIPKANNEELVVILGDSSQIKSVFAKGYNGKKDMRKFSKTEGAEDARPEPVATEQQPDAGRVGGRRITSGGVAALEGAPRTRDASGPDEKLVAVAKQYAEENGIPFRTQAEYVTVDEDRAKRIADAYEAMPHAPEDPVVNEAYQNLIRQTTAQYEALVKAGYKFWYIDPEGPSASYGNNPWTAMRDIRKNKQMGVFPTDFGFGSGATDADVSNNPLLAATGYKWPYGGPDGPLMPVLANDLFRAVHDAFGHGLEGAGFRARGEENAWQAHIRLFTGSAKGAITTETRGQNSWLNYGPHGENNRNAPVEDTVFADQKTGLMPEWTWKEGLAPDEPQEATPSQVDPQRGQAAAEEVAENGRKRLSALLSSTTVGNRTTPQVGPKDLMKRAETLRYAGVQQKVARIIQKTVGRLFKIDSHAIDQKTTDFMTKMQDSMLPLGKLYDNLRAKGIDIGQEYDAYFQETMMHGVAGSKKEKFDRTFLTPTVKRMLDAKFTEASVKALTDVSKVEGGSYVRDIFQKVKNPSHAIANAYLYALHAKERNARISKMSDGKDTSGSGMTDQEADAIIKWVDALPSYQRNVMRDVADSVKKMIAETNREYVEAGLIPINAGGKAILEDGTEVDFPQYDAYVPLRGFSDAESEDEAYDGGSTSNRLGGRGKPNRSAAGRNSYAGDILVNVGAQHHAAIDKAERNKVGLSFLKMLRRDDVDLSNIAEVLKKHPMKKAVVNGTIRMVPDMNFDSEDMPILVVREGGKDVLIAIYDPRIAAAMKGTLSPKQAGAVMQSLHSITRLYANTLTSWNPVFTFSNLPRDIETALFNAQQYDMKGASARIVKNVAPAIKGIWGAIRENGGGSEHWRMRYKQFYEAGGQNVLNQMASASRASDDVQSIIKHVEDMESGNKLAKSKHFFTKTLLGFVEDANSSVENGTRLAFFDAMVEQLEKEGVPTADAVKRAAFAARNLTTNFGKGGEYKNGFNTAYLFYNASLQGSMAVFNSLVNSKTARKSVAAMVGIGFMLDMLNALVSGDDDEDGIVDYDNLSEHRLSNYLILPDVTGSGANISIPLAYGLSTFFNLGRVTSNLVRGQSGYGGTYTPSQAAASVVGTASNLINPFGGNNMLSMAAPTLLDLPVELVSNTNFRDQPIYKELSPFDQTKSRSALFWSTASPSAVWVSKFINDTVGGGTDVIPGEVLGMRVDIQPDVLEHVLGFVTGGIGSFAGAMLDTATSTVPDALVGRWEEDMVNKTPFLNKFLVTVTEKDRAGDYYEKRDDVMIVAAEMKAAREAGDAERMNAVRRAYPERVAVVAQIKAIESQLTKLRKVKKAIQRSATISEEERQRRLDIVEERMNALMSQGNEIMQRAGV